MRSYRYVIEEKYQGMRVQDYLKQVHGYSRRNLIKLKQLPDGLVLNGKRIRTVDLLHTGDLLETAFPDDLRTPVAVPADPAIIRYEDDDVMVLDKPPFMPVHESKLHQEDTLANLFAGICEQRGQPLAFRPVNRLDRDTSGLVVAAKNSHYASILWKSVKKEYLAVICGVPQQDFFRIEAPISRKEDSLIERCVREDGQYALTDCQVLSKGEGYSLCRVRIATGRTHQIRVHMAYLGYPLAGDTLYGMDQKWIDRHALHCFLARFPDLSRQHVKEVFSPLPQDFLRLMERTGLTLPRPMPDFPSDAEQPSGKSGYGVPVNEQGK